MGVHLEGYQELTKLTIESGVTVNGYSIWANGVIGKIAPLDSVTFNGAGISLVHFYDYSIKNCVFNGSNIALGLDECHNCIISNNIVENCGWSGIYLYGSDNNSLTNNTANNNGYGIYLYLSSNNTLTDNTANNNGDDGIYLAHSSSNNTLTDNTANGNGRYDYPDAGIYLSGSNNTLTGNTANNNRDDGIHLDDSSSNTLTGNTANNNSDHGIHFDGSSSSNMLTSNTANNNGDDGIHLDALNSNNTLTSNSANNNGHHGISLYNDIGHNYYTSHNIFSDNTANNNGGTGIYLRHSSYNTVSGNTANNNSRSGISLSYSYDWWKYSDNDMVTGNTAKNNGGTGISLGHSNNSTVTGNTANNNRVSGIRLESKCSSNNIENNVLVRDTTKGDSWSIYVDSDAAEDNIFKENTVGGNYPTKISFHDYHEGFKIRGVENPPEPPKPPEYLTIRQSISKYVEMENLSAETTLFLDFHYEDKDVKDINEETLKVWKHNGTAWDEGRCADAWNGTRKLDTVNNIVGVEVKKFCIFAPLAGLPVHNINTEEDFYTIQAAIDDYRTLDGHTITVDLSYTEAGTKENICVDKELTIKANYYGCYDTIIEAADSGKHVIEVIADEVAIQGFSIKGATGEEKAGVYILSSTTDCTISQSILTDNNLGILCDIAHALVLENVKVWNNGKDGVRLLGGDLVIKGTDNEIINNGGNGTVAQNGNITIEGTTEIHDNGGWGIIIKGGNLDISDGAMSSINRNGKGGIDVDFGVNLPANFVVDDNGGPGIVGCGGVEDGVWTDTLILESVKVRNNKGDGIYVHEFQHANLLIKGTGNEITNNGGNGTFAEDGNITIEGTTEIHDNGGWGIHSEGGNVDIHNGAMSSINRNGKGGICCVGLKLPANFVVDDNGGHGIVAGGGVVSGVVTDKLILESVKVRNNNGDGIGVHDFLGCSLLIKGTGNEIINNGGNGTCVLSHGVKIEGTTEIHDNGGWGIHTEGGKVNIRDAEITNNANGGIRLFSSEHGTLTGNTVSNNGEYGICLFTSNDNTIYNNIFDNPKNAVDDGTNTWNIAKTAGTNIVGGPYLGGNYWSDYE